uniref:ubiquitinyl hydrolase 1 n=1 Tax=Clastoptera arizonana TaxID=38151 RepID=A0A1B6CUT1_9HEMI
MEIQESSEEIIQRHKKEKKDLQGKIQALKKSATKGDKKKKKEVSEEIAHLENELEKKHEDELLSLQSSKTNANVAQVTDELNNVNIDTDDEVPGLTQHRITKAQRRRDKKASQLKQRELGIAEQQIENLHGVRNIEIQELKKILKARNLMVHEIPSDGNCLYCAIEHQLKILDGPTAPNLNELRTMTSDFLREHSVDFLPYLSHPDTGEMLTEQQFQEYCDQVANTPAWGGQVELKALSHILHCCIEVIQSTSPPVIIGEEYLSNGHKLILIYHRHMYGLGEHYNSVKPYEDKEDTEFSERGTADDASL